MIFNEKYKLSNGIEIPKLGLGTWMISDENVVDAVVQAIKMGYRHIDTAQAYANEIGVGKGVKASGIPRNEILVTTKLASEVKSYEGAVASIEGSLQKLDLEYIDLMIIHSPKPWANFLESEPYFEGNLAAWKALEEAYQAGRIKAIGVSNFEIVDLKNILDNATLKPMVNQILTHISNTPKELIDFCKEQNILVEAYSPFGHGELFKNEQVQAMAAKYKVSVSQLAIRYCLQLGLLPLPKTANPQHMEANAAVDFEISESDMLELQNIKTIENYGEHSHFPVFGRV
ncbi:MAG: aldo/keto reductase [Saprospiraceae bacterium]|nr:aldo/keto reductase [Saprospiraceae bacterium]QLH28612.1 MAG: aldo/keto reductase [Candidatus Parvibacillus calidus]WKZ64201.1 MAG: aldo/keto reductase [Saprospiraceae bacterium]